jgi:hypothetical protein
MMAHGKSPNAPTLSDGRSRITGQVIYPRLLTLWCHRHATTDLFVLTQDAANQGDVETVKRLLEGGAYIEMAWEVSGGCSA